MNFLTGLVSKQTSQVEKTREGTRRSLTRSARFKQRSSATTVIRLYFRAKQQDT